MSHVISKPGSPTPGSALCSSSAYVRPPGCLQDVACLCAPLSLSLGLRGQWTGQAEGRPLIPLPYYSNLAWGNKAKYRIMRTASLDGRNICNVLTQHKVYKLRYIFSSSSGLRVIILLHRATQPSNYHPPTLSNGSEGFALFVDFSEGGISKTGNLQLSLSSIQFNVLAHLVKKEEACLAELSLQIGTRVDQCCCLSLMLVNTKQNPYLNHLRESTYVFNIIDSIEVLEEVGQRCKHYLIAAWN